MIVEDKKTNRSLVSIVTVTFNSEQYINDTLQSIKYQTYTNFEYIVIDGLSTDNTVSIVNRFRSEIPQKVTVISERDNGIYDAMNKGIELSKGELVCILNSDDWFEPEALHDFVRGYEASGSKYQIIVGDTMRVSEDKTNLFKVQNSEEKFRRNIGYTMSVSHPSVCVPKNVYSDLLGLFNTQYKILADYDLIYRASRNSNIEFSFLNKQVVNMREGGVSDSFKPKIIFLRSYERFKIRKSTLPFFKNAFLCTKFFLEEFLRQFLKKYFPNSFLLKNKRK